MCTSKTDGGKRCRFHTNKDYKAAVARSVALTGDEPPADVAEVHARYEKAVAEYAAEPSGLMHLRKRASDIEAGDTLDGDDLEVLRRYAPEKVPSATTVSLMEAFATDRAVREVVKPRVPVVQVPRVASEFALTLAEALAYDKTMRADLRTTKTVAPSRAWDDTEFAAALRGDTSPFKKGETPLPDGIDENHPPMLR